MFPWVILIKVLFLVVYFLCIGVGSLLGLLCLLMICDVVIRLLDLHL